MAEAVAIVAQIAAIGDDARAQRRKARGAKRGSAAYEPRTRVITALLQPKPDSVAELRAPERGGDVEVLLATSHALHLLSRRRPRFTRLLAILRRAHKAGTPLWITETLDSHEILDARPLDRGDAPAR